MENKDKETESMEIEQAVNSSLNQPWEKFDEKVVNLEEQQVEMEVEINDTTPPPQPPSKITNRRPWDFSPLDPDEWGFCSGEFICVYCGQGE